ncbi:FxSxx-COOH system tetratricopeptide repeat protein [Streptomyces sp. CAU 1734]|uniref:FxSxx-COOH system tetratricopeptide repeat protein n=1 Tax=Streptomyces sp. CAU 1734 TaxID=3140360 RepID=UPI0032601320
MPSGTPPGWPPAGPSGIPAAPSDRASERPAQTPSWSELADALYLAACRDAAEPPRPAPGGEPPPADSGQHRDPPEHPPPGGGSGTPEAEPPGGAAPGARGGTGAAAAGLTGGPHGARHPAESGDWTAAPRLAHSLALGRALRPLRLSRASPHEQELDEESTAERAAVDRLWTPVCRSVPERLLDLILLVDAGPPMALWRQTAQQLRELMEQTAAFRTVRLVRWDLDGAVARGGPAVAAQAGERQLLLVVTDGGHAAWRDGRAASALHRLAASSPTAVLSLLPQHLWDLTLPTVVRTRLRATAPGAPNRAYETAGADLPADGPGPWPEPPAARYGAGRAIPVPVVELRPDPLRRWARLVRAANRAEWHSLATLLTGPEGDQRAELAETGAELSVPEESPVPEGPGATRAARAAATVRRFRAAASPASYVLARRLAAVPLNLPVMRLLQQRMPEAGFWNLAEIVLRGLVRRTGAPADIEDAHRVTFDFPEGVREELLALGSRAETLGSLREVQHHLGPRLEAVWGAGGAALVSPDDEAAEPPLTDQTRPFVSHLHTALCALSGPFLGRADQLGQLLRQARPGEGTDEGHDGGPGTGPGEDPGRGPGTGPGGDPGHGPGTGPGPAAGPESGTGAGPHRPPSAPPPPHPLPGTPPPYGSGPAAARTSPTGTPALPEREGDTVSSGLPGASGPGHPPRILGNLPQRNRNFTGRERLLDLLGERLSGGTTAVLPEALHGMGGVGKSQIAIEYVYRHSREYRLIWWIPSEQENQIVQSLIELGEQMGLQAGSQVSAVPAVLRALRRGEPYADWLLVFDNAENPEEVSRYFPGGGPGRVLVTSRNSEWSATANSLEVNVFTRGESVALLRRRSPQLTESATDMLAAALGDLPLAVEQAAVWLAETGMPVRQYLELFERKRDELLASDAPADYEMPVAAAWNVSLERLREDRPDALHLLQVCAFFAPEPISWELFSAVRGVSVPPALQSTLDDPIKLSRAVREIGRYALARIDHRQNTIQLHRLVQRVLVEQMEPEQREQMRHAAHQLLSNADPRNPQRAAHWPRYSALLPHLRASNAVECEEGWTRRLVLNEVWFLRSRGDYNAALALGEQAAEIWRRHLGPEHEEVLAIDQQIAETLREQGSDLARSYNLQSALLERFRAVLGDGHEDTLQAHSFMANHHRHRGDFYQAREMDLRVYETTTREFGPDDPATLLSAHNYAVSLRLTGDAEAARALDLDTWQRRIEVLGSDHLYTLTTYNAYLLDLQEVGRYEEALEGYEELVVGMREQFGEDHWFTIQVMRNLCVTRRKKGDHNGAHELSSYGMRLVRKRFGEQGRSFMQMALAHASTLRRLGRYREAHDLCAQVLGLHHAKYGREHPHSHAIAMNLAVILRLLGEPDRARVMDLEAVDGLTRTLGAEHPRTLLARMNLASDLFALGDHEQAHAIDAAVARRLEQLRLRHPANLGVHLNLSLDLKALNRTEECRIAYLKAVALHRELLGPDHPATRDAEQGFRANADIDLTSV